MQRASNNPKYSYNVTPFDNIYNTTLLKYGSDRNTEPQRYQKLTCDNIRAVLFHSEILFVKELLMSNGYPANFIDSIVHRFLSKQFSNTDVMQPYGPRKRRVYLCLPYVGELATNKFARQIRRQIAKIAPCVELRLVFRAAVISVDNNDYRLQIKEALKIKDLKAYNSLNANIRSCELKLW